MLRNLLLCGLLAGLCAGLLATGFAEVAGEPAIDAAIVVERSETGRQEAAQSDVVSRGLQRTAGLLTAVTVYGVALGGLFALAFAVVYGRVGRAGPARAALWLAATAFVVLFLVPFVKYPANPPATAAEGTIGGRTALHFVMVLISLLAAIAAVRVRGVLAGRLSPAASSGGGVTTYLAVVVVAGIALPTVSEVPRGFPATTLWEFRQATVGLQLVMWSAIGVVFAATAQRVVAGRPLLPTRSPVPRSARPTTAE